MKNKKGYSLLWIILILILILAGGFFVAKFTDLFSLSKPTLPDCASLETGQNKCCIENNYGYWDESKQQCVSDVNENPESNDGGGGK